MRKAAAALPVGDYIDNPRTRPARRHRRLGPRAPSSDREALRRFFHDLSPESRRRRFFTPAEPADALIDALPTLTIRPRLTLIVDRYVGAEQARRRPASLRPIAVGSYLAISDRVAEAAFAVDDRFQGKGLGTMLLERLAAIAAGTASRGSRRRRCPTTRAMLEVFRDSGFEIRSKTQRGAVDLQLSLDPVGGGSACRRGARPRGHRGVAAADARAAAVAVIGASRDPASIGRRVLDALARPASTGRSIRSTRTPPSSTASPCYPSARELPRGHRSRGRSRCRASAVLDVVDDCAAAGVKSLVVITAGFAETGDAGRALQQQLVERVRGYGMRMVGPNCMGLLNATPDVQLNASFSPVVPPSRQRRVLVAERRARPGDPRARRGSAASACRRSSASATRPTCRATTCCSTGSTTRPRA